MNLRDKAQKRTHALMRPTILVLAALLLLDLGTLLPNRPVAAPVTASPQTTTSFTPVADATLDSALPDVTLGTEDSLQVLYGGSPSEISRALIRFNVSSIPPEAIIDSATLRLQLTASVDPSPLTLTASNVISDWVESMVTWNNAPANDEPAIPSPVGGTIGEVTLDVADLVRAWHNQPHYGLLLSGPESGPSYGRTFESRHPGTNPPQLEVSYHLPPILPELTFQGYVYEGEPPATDTPLEDAWLALYGDADGLPHNGPWHYLASAGSGADGAFSLYWQGEPFPFYHLVQTAPQDRYPIAAQAAPPGSVSNADIVTFGTIDSGTYGGITFWDQPLPLGCQQWLANEDFERGSLQPWGSSGAASLGPGRLDSWGVQFAGDNGATGELWQGVLLPEGADLVLSFWWRAESAAEQPGDALSLILQYGEEQADLLRVLPAVEPLGQWRYAAVDLSAYTGRELALTFLAHTDAEVPSTFSLDDVSLLACGATPPDLIVTGAGWELGEGICYQVLNVGQGVAPAGHQAALWVEGALAAEQWVDSVLSPGERHGDCFDYVWSCTLPEDVVAVWADAGERLAESDEDNNRREEVWPCDTDPPRIIAGPEVTAVFTDSAVIYWETDEPGDSVLRYGLTARLLDSEVADPTLVFSHTLTLNGLEPSTTYQFLVRSTDASSNTVESRPYTFQTLALPDDQDPVVEISDPGLWRDTVRVTATASDNRGVEKVAFCLVSATPGPGLENDDFCIDGEVLLIDYSAPFEVDVDTTLYANGPYTLTARAYDLFGRWSDDKLRADLANLVDPNAPSITITSPTQGQTVSGKVNVVAQLSDDNGLAYAYAWVNGDFEAYQPLPGNPKNYTLTFEWDTTEVTKTNTVLAIDAYDTKFNKGQAIRNVTVSQPSPPPLPKLKIIKHEVSSKDNAIEVLLKVQNVGQGKAVNVAIQDSLRAFQVISRSSSTPHQVDYEASYVASNKLGNCTITDHADIAPGATRTYTYTAIPLLVYPSPPTPAVGEAVKLWYEDESGSGNVETVDYLVSLTTGDVPIATAHANALKQAVYLIVTHPQRLFGYNVNTKHVDDLLSEMAELAYHKSGALGYLYLHDRDALDALIAPANAVTMLLYQDNWAMRLHPNFTKLMGGGLLIVGEIEIVPAWDQGGFSIGWNPVNYSDQPYADTGGGSPAPELLVGRVVGDKATTLIKPIQASIGVHTRASGYAFSRDKASLISGPGLGTFVQGMNQVEPILQDKGWNVTKVHLKDYFYLGSFALPYQKGDDFAVGEVMLSNPDDEIVFADSSADKILIYDKDGGTPLASFSLVFDDGDQIAIANSNIVVADASANQIRICNTGGQQSSFALDFEPFDGLSAGDAVGDGYEEISIADQSADKVYFYTVNGVKLSEEVSQTFDKYDLFVLGDVWGGLKDDVVLTDRSAGKLLIYSADGTLRGTEQFDTVTLQGKTMSRLEYYDYDTGKQLDVGGSGLATGQLHPYPSGADSGKEEILIAPGRNYDHIFVFYWHPTKAKLLGTTPIPWNFDEYEGLATGEIGTYLTLVQDEVFVADMSGHVRILDTNNWLTRFHNQLDSITQDADLLYLSGHGLTDGCCGMSSYYDPVWPLDFNQHNPVAWATSCFTGNYQDKKDKTNFADTMLDSGAAIYIGATQSSHGGEDIVAANWLFGHWDAGESIGKVFTELERTFWKGSTTDNWWFWAYEYNLYGDPLYGAATSSQALELTAPQQPDALLEIQVPDYIVTATQGVDWVEIPGGRLPGGPGELRLPSYVRTYQFPAGQRVQGVELLDLSEPLTGTGLIAPMLPSTITGCQCTVEPYSGPVTGWYPGEQYHWDTLENPDGTTTLVITVYPFHYNTLTTDFRFFRHYTFEVMTTTSTVAVTGLATGRTEYGPGEPVGIPLGLENTGPAQDVIVSALIKRAGRQETVDGLLLETLGDLGGPASFTLQWDPGGAEHGPYYVEVTLQDTAGNLLHRASKRFELGITGGEIISFAAGPEQFEVGDAVAISLTFENTGTVPLTGTASIQVLDGAGDLVAEFAHEIASLPAGQSVPLEEVWDTTGIAGGTYRIVAHVAYDSTTTDPATAEVSARSRIYLPLVMRKSAQ